MDKDKIRHLYKTVTWRILATTDTFLLAFILTGTFEVASAIAMLEIMTKTVLYYIHERVWFKHIRMD